MGIAVGSVLVVFGLTFLLGVIEHFFPDISENLIDTSAVGWICVVVGSLIIVLGLQVTSSAPTVVCWNGQDGANREACGEPVGVAGLRTVFPSMRSCRWTSTAVAGKAEVYVCDYEGFLIRYTRWNQEYDRYGYLNSTNQIRGVRWKVGNELAGRQWTSHEDSPSEDEPYQWSATYRDHPYSVSVEAISPAARQRGLALVECAEPSRIGLR